MQAYKTTASVCVLVVVAWTGRSALGQASFSGLGSLEEGRFYSAGTGVSADGLVVVGHSSSAGGIEAFRWTAEDGMVGLGNPPGSVFNGTPYGISSDGSVIVGGSDTAPVRRAFRWTADAGFADLGDLPGGPFESQAFDVSADGSIIVGFGTSDSDQHPVPCRWTEAEGIVSLGDLAGSPLRGIAYAVSTDGSVVVGSSQSGPFRWTADAGAATLGGSGGMGWDVSADGSVVVGSTALSLAVEAFRWTSEGGMIGLGDLPGGSFYSHAYGVSADGSIVVGRATAEVPGNPLESRAEAFIWDQGNGMRNLREVLKIEYGLDLIGWTLTEARGISADGWTIVGHGVNPDGFREAWIARLPEPTTLSLLALGGVVVVRGRWAGRRFGWSGK